ncbi:sulfur carrier protein ThiS [Rubellicoccus peritrichatus]|uniref:Sulfur carrier protein ThiS n=1 Tax=Rubellicoccus peritrichatus TaxID=3080537 RepID=A0AAQ3LBK4_9BACT|nr:sulfur carrier protein ThiS [Puniceicoccus sp. CR14]WOO42845.1 sulfur carrier protein ThiS [Puniceicoccus sp. CR14]
MGELISIIANGDKIESQPGKPLPELITELGLAPDKVVVERNRAALTPAELRETSLEDGDVLEIVRIVAGG